MASAQSSMVVVALAMGTAALRRIGLAAICLLTACATVDDGMVAANRTVALGIRNPPTCCRSLAEVLSRAGDFAPGAVALNPTSPHFDFGDGTAPFVVWRLPPGEGRLEFEAYLELVGWAYGGDGVPRYLAAEALFFDTAFQRVEATGSSRQQRMTGQSSRSLIRTFAIPPGATFVILTTNPKIHGTKTAGTIEGLALLPLVPYTYTLASYGRGSLRLDTGVTSHPSSVQ